MSLRARSRAAFSLGPFIATADLPAAAVFVLVFGAHLHSPHSERLYSAYLYNSWRQSHRAARQVLRLYGLKSACSKSRVAALRRRRAKMSVSAASIRRSNLGEGPHWDPASKTLLHVDAPVGDLCRLDVVTRDTSGIHFDGLVTIAIPYKSDPNLNVITLNREVRKFDWTTSQSEVLTEVDSDKPKNKFNDGKCDVTGRLWAGTMGEHQDEHMIDKENGSLFSIDPATLNVTSHVTKMNISNGMTWSPDNRSMFYIDSFTRSVYSFGFDATSGQLSNRQVLVDFNVKEEYKDCGYPDGMTVDTNGKLWVACYAAGRVINIDPETGKLLRSVLLPASKTTSCCFGGDNYDELYVTSAWKGLTPDQLRAEPLAGSVFKVTCLGAKGFEAHAFNR